MPLLTLLCRVSDGLMLSESMDSGKNETVDMEYARSQAKQIFKTLSRKSQNRMYIESGSYYFAYVQYTTSLVSPPHPTHLLNTVVLKYLLVI